MMGSGHLLGFRLEKAHDLRVGGQSQDCDRFMGCQERCEQCHDLLFCSVFLEC